MGIGRPMKGGVEFGPANERKEWRSGPASKCPMLPADPRAQLSFRTGSFWPSRVSVQRHGSLQAGLLQGAPGPAGACHYKSKAIQAGFSCFAIIHMKKYKWTWGPPFCFYTCPKLKNIYLKSKALCSVIRWNCKAERTQASHFWKNLNYLKLLYTIPS